MNSYNYSGEMKVPMRAAPLPPTGPSPWSSSIFAPRDNSATLNNISNMPKKKPPPRPPPPKFKHSRHSEGRGLVPSLFPNRSQTRPIYEPVSSGANTGCLIDWSSPPSSPLSTTRSSSDALSVHSFGSDSVTPSSGSTSNVESGFEDDFELFGAPSQKPFDPWSPPPLPKPQQSFPSTKSSWISFSPTSSKKLSMPTIIRAKPERPKPPKILEKKLEMDALAQVFEKAQISSTNGSRNILEDDEDEWDSESPPMPTIPAPAPPPELLAQYLSEEVQPKSAKTEIAVALYDYQGAPGDLSFRQGERISILRHIDENWYEGQLNGVKGTVPANFLQMEASDPRVVTALYSFTPETWEDLALRPGLRVRLLGKVDASWLYGEADGRRGQFPLAFVDHVPHDLPFWRS